MKISFDDREDYYVLHVSKMGYGPVRERVSAMEQYLEKPLSECKTRMKDGFLYIYGENDRKIICNVFEGKIDGLSEYAVGTFIERFLNQKYPAERI